MSHISRKQKPKWVPYDSRYNNTINNSHIQPHFNPHCRPTTTIHHSQITNAHNDNDAKHNDTERAEPRPLNFEAAKKTQFKQDKIICIKDNIWISTGNQDGAAGMIGYNYVTTKTSFIPYPEDIILTGHSCCRHSDKICIINGCDGSVIRFNPKRETIVKVSNIPNLGNATSCVAIHDDIHIFGGSNNNKHIIRPIEGKKDDFYELPDPAGIDGKNIMNQCVVSYRNKIIKFGGRYFDEILSCFYISSTIYRNNYKNIKWASPVQFRLPHGLCECGYILYEHYVITFGGNTPTYIDTIYVLDVEKNIGWMRMKHIRCPIASNYRAVLDDEQVVHLYSTINKWPNWKDSVVKHFTIPIENILNGLNEGFKDSLELQFNRVCGLNVGLMKENDELKSKNKQLIGERIQFLGTAQKELHKNRESAMKCINKLEADKDDLQKQLKEREEECKKLQLEMDESEDKYNEKIEEMRQYICQIEAEKEFLQRELYNIKQNGLQNNDNGQIEDDEIRPWSSDELVDWIVTIKDGQFSKYEDVLRESFNADNVNGLSLEHIDRAELRNWGIQSLFDRSVLYECIQELIKENNSYEGNDATTY